jgi:hypothetical protein
MRIDQGIILILCTLKIHFIKNAELWMTLKDKTRFKKLNL